MVSVVLEGSLGECNPSLLLQAVIEGYGCFRGVAQIVEIARGSNWKLVALPGIEPGFED